MQDLNHRPYVYAESPNLYNSFFVSTSPQFINTPPLGKYSTSVALILFFIVVTRITVGSKKRTMLQSVEVLGFKQLLEQERR